MMEWETGKHMCNKHEMNVQVLKKKKKNDFLKLVAFIVEKTAGKL